MSRPAGRLGWFLVWAVVFCDIGTSVYYVPGVLWASVGPQAGVYVLATLVAFVLLCVKEVETTRRFPSGGGVVSVADRAFGPWWGCLAGQLVMVDFFLTVAISAACGIYYLDALVPLGGVVLPASVACLGLLGVLNVIGLQETARVSLVLALLALVVTVVVVAVGLHDHPPAALVDRVVHSGVGDAGPWQLLVGYGGAWLAFSGLESMSQLAPAMRDLGATPRRGMLAVVLSVLVAAPALTLLTTVGLPDAVASAAPERLVAELARAGGGLALEIPVVLTAAALLFFAANTAMVGNYHVQLALTQRQFLPDALSALSRRFQTPHRAILLGTLVPVALLLATGADLLALAGLYAFGLLGAFVLGSVGIDVLRWREGERGARFWIGVLTSLAVVLAFVVNLAAKPMATAFGGSLAGLGMVIAVGTRRGWFDQLVDRIPRLRPPPVERSGAPVLSPMEARAQVGEGDPAGVMVASRGATRKLFREAVDRARARGRPRVFVLYVDEVPGLFYPHLAQPTPEGLTVLDAGCEMIRELGGEPVPLWTMSHSAPASVAEAAEICRCDTVVVGATQRTFLWQAMRGRFIQDLLRQLPSDIRLIVVG